MESHTLFTLQGNLFKAYGKRVLNEKDLLSKKTIQDGEKQRLREGEKKRQQEAQKLEQRRLNLFETVKELTKSEKQKDSEWQTPKTLSEEANERRASNSEHELQ